MNFVTYIFCVLPSRPQSLVLGVILAFTSVGSHLNTLAEESPFATPTIDIGVVVSDLEKSVQFYTKAIGFKEQPGFHVPGSYSSKVGLTDGRDLDIRVFTLGDGPGATKLKLMSPPDAKMKKSDNRFIHSQLGFSYLTIVVKDTAAALERLAKAKVKPIAQGAQELPEGLAKGIFLTIVRDPDGNFVELVGPKSK